MDDGSTMQAEGREGFDDELTGAEQRRAKRAPYRTPLVIAGPIVLVVAGLIFYLQGGRYETTENASLQSAKVQVSSSISGRVVDVAVQNNQQVSAGQVLFRLDPAPFQARVDAAQAKLASARLSVAALQANYRQGSSEQQAAQDRLRFAERERERQKALLAEGISSQAQYDSAVLAATVARQQIETVAQQKASVLATLGGDPGLSVDRNPAVQEAQAELDQAKLALNYAVVRAPQAGIVTKVDQLPVGNYVEASKPVFTLVGTTVWVEANFKEDQLEHMRPGQSASVKLDAYPRLRLTGRVASFSPGTGASFSLLPAENATGNWVKVTQRLPVELTLVGAPRGALLHAGLSAVVRVDTGHRRRLFGGAGTAPAK